MRTARLEYIQILIFSLRWKFAPRNIFNLMQALNELSHTLDQFIAARRIRDTTGFVRLTMSTYTALRYLSRSRNSFSSPSKDAHIDHSAHRNSCTWPSMLGLFYWIWFVFGVDHYKSGL